MSFGKRQPIGFRGVERRRDVREKTDVVARVMLPTGQTIRCCVNDFSKTGARLEVASAFGLPDMFELRAGGRTYKVSVMRRGTGRLGVKFV
jgi:hypothetical protein